MARIQRHHIRYKPYEWTIELGMLQHRCISRTQITKATPQAYADLTNFLHAVSVEWNRMREELDLEKDLRNLKPEELRKKKKDRKNRKKYKPKRKILRRKKPKAKAEVKPKPKREILRRKENASKNDPGVHKGKRNGRTARSKAVPANTNRRRA